MKKTILFLTCSLWFSLPLLAQKIELEQWTINTLAKQQYINIQFDYSGIIVGKLREKDYILQTVMKKNSRSPQSGYKWLNDWFGNREKAFEPQFIRLFNKYSPIQAFPGKEQKYTLIVHTYYIDPGYNIYVSRQPAKVSFEYIFIETANPDNVIAKFKQENVVGSNQYSSMYDYAVETRITECYSKGGKSLARLIAKLVKEMQKYYVY